MGSIHTSVHADNCLFHSKGQEKNSSEGEFIDGVSHKDVAEGDGGGKKGQGRVRKLCPPYSSHEISPFFASPMLNGARVSPPPIGNIAGRGEGRIRGDLKCDSRQKGN